MRFDNVNMGANGCQDAGMTEAVLLAVRMVPNSDADQADVANMAARKHSGGGFCRLGGA
jgi:hypothetical protein